jgi:hypothetical protein
MNEQQEIKVYNVEIPEELWVKAATGNDDRIMSCDD